MPIFGRKPRVAGFIAAYGLTDWWHKTFSDSEREAMTANYQPMGLPFLRSLTEGDMTRHGSSRGFLTTLAGWYNNPLMRPLAKRILHKAIETKDGNTMDDHFLYSQVVDVYYPDRETDPNALDLVIWACERQIDMQGKAGKQFKKDFPKLPLPHHNGFTQLAILREKQNRFDDAIRLSRDARKAGWAGDWDKRIQRLEAKKARSK